MNGLKTIEPDDQRLSWPGAVSLQKEAGWVMPWRIPHADRLLYPEPLIERASMPAGARIAFRSTAASIAGQIVAHPDATQVDLCCDGRFLQSAELAGQERFRFDGLPTGDKLIELWLPQFGEFRLRSIEIDDGATIAPFLDSRPRWITYGSSITQCRAAARPTLTWPAIVARERDLNLTCQPITSRYAWGSTSTARPA